MSLLFRRCHVLSPVFAAASGLRASARHRPSRSRAKQFKEALTTFDLAIELDPNNADAKRRRTWLISPLPALDEVDVRRLLAQVEAAPDDLTAMQSLDYALARQNRFDEIIPFWDGYLARHPKDGRALLERAGTYWHLGRKDDAREGARQACSLGVSEGCAMAEKAR